MIEAHDRVHRSWVSPQRHTESDRRASPRYRSAALHVRNAASGVSIRSDRPHMWSNPSEELNAVTVTCRRDSM